MLMCLIENYVMGVDIFGVFPHLMSEGGVYLALLLFGVVVVAVEISKRFFLEPLKEEQQARKYEMKLKKQNVSLIHRRSTIKHKGFAFD